jgi:hypothetical protein
MYYKDTNRYILLGCIGLLVLIAVALPILLLVGGVFSSVLATTNEPSAAERICDNLVAERLIEHRECVTDRSQTVYIPNYFPIGEVDFDYVSVGMRGFKLLKSTRSNACEGNKEFTRVTYLTGTTDNATFLFCGGILENIVYDD